MDPDDQNSGVFYCDKIIEEFDAIIENKDLESLIEIGNAKPIEYKPKRNELIENFIPNTLCEYRTKNEEQPIKTSTSIGSIRKSYEKDNFLILRDIVSQNEKLVAERFDNHSKPTDEVKLKELRELLKSCSPINRRTWMNLKSINLNLNRYCHQFIKVDGQTLFLAGTSGGSKNSFKFCSYIDVPKKFKEKSPINLPSPRVMKLSRINKNTASLEKKRLLNSIKINFKPGPRSKKPVLNNLFLNNNFGDAKLMNFPSVALEITPKIGTALDSHVCKYLRQVRSSDGSVDHAWADFASSVIQGVADKNPKTQHTFVIPYENNRSQILMKKDFDVIENNMIQINNTNKTLSLDDLNTDLLNLNNFKVQNDIDKVIKSMLDEMLFAIGIGEIQDKIINTDPDHITSNEESSIIKKHIPQFKPRKKKYINELKKLNVTVIDIETESRNVSCSNDHCKWGCICNSLKCNYLLKEHCGIPECMFKCTCELPESFRNEKDTAISTSTILNLQNQLNRNLAKEEQKFQRTVIRSSDETIVLGARRRGIKFPKKFKDFSPIPCDFLNMPKEYADAKVILPKLPNFGNCLYWCMTHQLYRCFCKGLFVEGKPFSTRKKINYAIYENPSDDDSTGNYIDKNENVLGLENIFDLSPESKINLIPKDKCKLNHNKKKNKSFKNKFDLSPKNKIDSFPKNKCDLNHIRKYGRIINSIPEEKSNTTPDDKCDPTPKDKCDLTPKIICALSLANKFDLSHMDKLNSSPENNLNPAPKKNLNLSSETQNLDKINLSTEKKMDFENKKIRPNLLNIKSSYITDTLKKYEKNNINGTKNDICTIFSVSGNNKFIKPISVQNKDGKNSVNVVLKPKKVVYTNNEKMIPPKEGSRIQIRWTMLMGQFMLNKIKIWITSSPPYLVFITTENTIPKGKLVDIIYAKKSLITRYPSYVNDIQEKKLANNQYLILYGHKYTWQIITVINNGMCIQNDITKGIINQNKWFMIQTGNDFSAIEIKAKKFSITYKEIKEAILLSNQEGNVIKFFSEDVSSDFGLHIFPNKTTKVYLGPYKEGEDQNIDFFSVNMPITKVFITKGIWLDPTNTISKAQIDMLNNYNEQANYKQIAQVQNNNEKINISPINYTTRKCLKRSLSPDRMNDASLDIANPKIVNVVGNVDSFYKLVTKERHLNLNNLINRNTHTVIKQQKMDGEDSDVLIVKKNDEIVEISDSE